MSEERQRFSVGEEVFSIGIWIDDSMRDPWERWGTIGAKFLFERDGTSALVEAGGRILFRASALVSKSQDELKQMFGGDGYSNLIEVRHAISDLKWVPITPEGGGA